MGATSTESGRLEERYEDTWTHPQSRTVLPQQAHGGSLIAPPSSSFASRPFCLLNGRLMFDARGEEDLRSAETSALAVVSGYDPTVFHTLQYPSFIKAVTKTRTATGGHIKGLLSWWDSILGLSREIP